MSIQTAINDLSARIQSAFTALEAKGIDVPAQKTTTTLKSILETAELCQTDIYTKIKYQNGVETFFEIDGTLDTNLIPNLSDIVEFNVGINVDDIASNMFSDCISLTSVTIHNKTWQDVIDNNYWGIQDPNIIHGDWDKQ